MEGEERRRNWPPVVSVSFRKTKTETKNGNGNENENEMDGTEFVPRCLYLSSIEPASQPVGQQANKMRSTQPNAPVFTACDVHNKPIDLVGTIEAVPGEEARFRTLCTLMDHRKLPSHQTFRCPFPGCISTFKGKTCAIDHINTMHIRFLAFACHQCNRQWTTRKGANSCQHSPKTPPQARKGRSYMVPISPPTTLPPISSLLQLLPHLPVDWRSGSCS